MFPYKQSCDKVQNKLIILSNLNKFYSTFSEHSKSHKEVKIKYFNRNPRELASWNFPPGVSFYYKKVRMLMF